MKRLLFLGALALAAIIVSACSSPTDVPAGRKVTTPPTPLVVVQRAVDLGKISANSSTKFNVKVENTSTTEEVVITEARLKNGSVGFSIQNILMPITLGRKGTIFESADIPIVFAGRPAGIYRDTLIINGDTSLTCVMTIEVLNNAVVVSDVDLGTMSVGAKQAFTFSVTNNGDADAIITSYAIEGTEASSYMINFTVALPVALQPGQTINFTGMFGAAKVGAANAVVNFQIIYSGSGLVDKYCILSGMVQ